MSLFIEVNGERHLLDSTNIYTLGRGDGVDIKVNHSLISRRHCRFFHNGQNWQLEDVGSSHGTFVDGIQISSLELKQDVTGTLGGKGGISFSVKILSERPKVVAQREEPTNQPETRLRIPLGNRIRIGTDSRNDWVINDLAASSFHAEIGRNASGKYEIQDLKSINGVHINGKRLLRALLQEGDIIRIGETQKKFTLDGLEDVTGIKGARVKLSGVSFITDSGATLLHDISLNLGPATLTAIVGPSGAGKSTLMDVITGKKKISQGMREIKLENEVGTYSNIGFVPQADILHTKLTVRQALNFGADLRFPSSTSRQKKKERIEEVLKLVELDSRADLRIDKLSGGQRKRCSIALELLSKPDLLVLDEPTSGLDPGLDLHFMELMRRLTLSGQTVVVVTHAVDNVNLCDNVVLMQTGGTIAYFGPPQAVLSTTKEESWAHLFRKVSTPAKQKKPSRHEFHDFEDEKPISQQNVIHQIFTLSQRYISVIAADRFYLALLVILPLMLGFIGYASGNDFGLSQSLTTKGTLIPNPQARMLTLILVLGSVFLALAASIQEIVKEADIRSRELRIGVRNIAYIASKIIVIGTIVLLQVTGFFYFTFFGRDAGSTSLIFENSKTEIFLICVALAICSMCLGILISTLISSQEQGMPTLVLTTMAQIVISGALPIRIDWLTESIGIINPSYWAMNAIGASANLNLVTALEGDDAFGRWDNTLLNAQTPFAVLFVMTLILVVLSVISVSRKR